MECLSLSPGRTVADPILWQRSKKKKKEEEERIFAGLSYVIQLRIIGPGLVNQPTNVEDDPACSGSWCAFKRMMSFMNKR